MWFKALRELSLNRGSETTSLMCWVVPKSQDKMSAWPYRFEVEGTCVTMDDSTMGMWCNPKIVRHWGCLVVTTVWAWLRFDLTVSGSLSACEIQYARAMLDDED